MVSTMQEPHDSHMMSTEEVKRKKTGAEWGWGGGDDMMKTCQSNELMSYNGKHETT